MSEQDETLQSGRPAAGGIPDTLRNQLHEFEAVCAELEGLPTRTVEDYPAELARICAAHQALPPVPPEYAEILEKRFVLAREAAERAAAENEAQLQQRAAKLQECVRLSGELDTLLAGAELVTLGEVEALEKRWADCLKTVDPTAVDLAGFENRIAPLRERLRAEAEADRVRGEQALQLAEELSVLTAGENMDLLRDRKAAMETQYAALGKVPKAAADKYNAAHRAAGTRLAQHYETLDLARWESYTLKLDLCAELDKLTALPDNELPKAAKALRELREKWKTLGGVPKVKNEEINTRYLDLTRALQHRVDEYFAKHRQEQKQAAAAKQELVNQAAALTGSTEWNATAAQFKELQAAWKTIPNAGQAEKGLFTAFRAAADQFFNARSAWFDERNSRFEAMAEAKKKLIAEAETLTAQPRSEAVARRAKELRAEYQAIGPAGRSETELLGKFNAALDHFFAGRREEFAEREARSRALIAELDAFVANPTDPAEAETRARAIRGELRELACRNTFDLEHKAFDRFEKALTAARGRVLTDKLTLVKTVARPLAAALGAWKRGEAVDEAVFNIEFLERFPKLHTAAGLLRAAMAGDDRAAEKLDKMVAASAAEHRRVCSALEKLVGVKEESSEPAAMSLADELQAAIAGNFMKSNIRAAERTVDPKQLLAEYLNAGLMPEADLESSFERFDRAYGQLR